MDELYHLSKNIDQVRMEQCDQTKFMAGMTNIFEESKTKTEIIKMLSENVNTTTAYWNISENKKVIKTNQLILKHKQQMIIFAYQEKLLKSQMLKIKPLLDQ